MNLAHKKKLVVAIKHTVTAKHYTHSYSSDCRFNPEPFKFILAESKFKSSNTRLHNFTQLLLLVFSTECLYILMHTAQTHWNSATPAAQETEINTTYNLPIMMITTNTHFALEVIKIN